MAKFTVIPSIFENISVKIRKFNLFVTFLG